MLQVKCGSSISIKANFTGKPSPSVFVSKNGIQLNESNVVVDKKIGLIKLQINEATRYVEANKTAEKLSTNLNFYHLFINRADTGKYVVTIANQAGQKEITCDVKVLDSPSAPRDLTIKNVSSSSATLKWLEPENDGGSLGVQYSVEVREADVTTWTMITPSCIRTSQTVQGLNLFKMFRKVLKLRNYGIL